MPEYQRWEDSDLLLTLHVQPRASHDEFVGPHGDALKVRITAPPVDGKANAHLRKFLAGMFGVHGSDVHLQSGAGGRRKVFRIHAPRILPEHIEKP